VLFDVRVIRNMGTHCVGNVESFLTLQEVVYIFSTRVMSMYEYYKFVDVSKVPSFP
jgi:hypothetical protein